MGFSVGAAVGSGFALIGRRPLAVIVWGLILVVAGFLGQVLAIALFGYGPAGGPIAGAVPGVAGQIAEQLGRSLAPLVFTLPASALLTAAVTRAVLRPEERAIIRFGPEEGALLILNLLFVVAGVVVGGGSFALFGGLMLATVKVGGGIGGGVLIFFGAIAYGLALMWLALRFSLAPAMTFTDRRVRLLESWTATRGQGWRLFGLAWLLILIALGLGLGLLILAGVLIAVFAGLGVGMAGLDPRSFAQDPSAIMGRIGPMLIIFGLIFIGLYVVVAGFFQAIFQAPWADTYRQLRGNTDVSATFA